MSSPAAQSLHEHQRPSQHFKNRALHPLEFESSFIWDWDQS